MVVCSARPRLRVGADDTLVDQAMSGSTAMMSNKKQREVYVGNLTIGVVNDVMLRDLFNGALSHLVADPHINPPVVSTSMDPSGEASAVAPCCPYKCVAVSEICTASELIIASSAQCNLFVRK